MSSRPLRSGRSTSTWRSKRPGRISAGSRISGRLVAASTISAGAGVEAVHLREHLVQRLLALVVAAEHARVAALADGVQLVDEDDGRRLGRGLLEEVAHARRAHADEHLHELGAGEAEERNARLARDGAREQRLAGARRPDQQHALGDAPAQPPELGRRLEELDDLLQLVRRLVDAGHVLEGRRRCSTPCRRAPWSCRRTSRPGGPPGMPPRHPPREPGDEERARCRWAPSASRSCRSCRSRRRRRTRCASAASAAPAACRR